MFQQKGNHKYLKFGFVPLFILLSIASFGQTHTNEESKLKLNQTIERELAGRQSHAYPVSLKANELLQVRVEQKGIDVVVKVFDSNKKLLAEMDSPNGASGVELLSFVTFDGASMKSQSKH